MSRVWINKRPQFQLRQTWTGGGCTRHHFTPVSALWRNQQPITDSQNQCISKTELLTHLPKIHYSFICTQKNPLLCLFRKKKRMIADLELGYAVLYSSTESFCNPDVIRAYFRVVLSYAHWNW